MITWARPVRYLAVGVAAAVTLATGCIAGGGGGYDDTASVSYGVGFYEPYGYDYSGWGPGYRVGPSRGGDRRRDRPGRPFHAPQPSHSTPSIPSRPRPHH
jgi:hypothetical protein